jgi:hypothetical protein
VKTLGRILIILAAFTVVMGITYMVVNAGSSSTSANMPAFENGGEGGPRPEGARPQFSNGERPEFSGGGRPAFGGGGQRGGGWMSGLVKNVGILAIIVVLITVLKSFMRRKSVPVQVE